LEKAVGSVAPLARNGNPRDDFGVQFPSALPVILAQFGAELQATKSLSLPLSMLDRASRDNPRSYKMISLRM